MLYCNKCFNYIEFILKSADPVTFKNSFRNHFKSVKNLFVFRFLSLFLFNCSVCKLEVIVDVRSIKYVDKKLCE